MTQIVHSDFAKILISIFAIGMAVIGTIGNLFIVGAILVERRLKYVGNVFVANLAMADILVTTIIFPCMALNVLHGDSVVSRGPTCQVLGFIVVLSCVSSMGNIALISLDRYFCVCNEAQHQRYFNKRYVIALSVFMWIYPFILSVPTFFFGVGDFSYDPHFDICTISFPGDQIWFALWGICFGVYLPIAVCFFCYLKIYFHVRKAKRRVHAHRQGATVVARQQAPPPSNTSKQSDVDLYKTLFLIFFLFFLFWLPYALCQMLITIDTVQISDFLIRCSGCLALFNSVINSWIYGITNKNFKGAYYKLLQNLLQPFQWLWSKLRANKIESGCKVLLSSDHVLTQVS